MLVDLSVIVVVVVIVVVFVVVVLVLSVDIYILKFIFNVFLIIRKNYFIFGEYR